MLLFNEILIFLIIIKQNKNYNCYFKKNNFPCIITNSNNLNSLIFKLIKINNDNLISVKNILNLIKSKKKNTPFFFENKFSNLNTLLDLFVYK